MNRRVGRHVTALVIASSALATVGAVAAPPAIADDSVTVMSRNIYLGADVGVALSLIPNMPAAAQRMWDQMRATDFTARAPLLAAEAAEHRPAVIGIQEATTWSCAPDVMSGSTIVRDFLQELLVAMRATGVEYVIASGPGRPALNPGYSIPPLPGITMVHDPQTFMPLFGTQDAACGFTISDALLVRADIAGDVRASGTVEYARRTSIVPVLMEVTRGYAWADIAIAGVPARFVTTHLESLVDPGVVPSSAVQARQLVADLSDTAMPLIVMGDFNSDPRDPREPGANPGGQPQVGAGCPAGGSECSAYRAMADAGYANAGPSVDDPANLTWGASALLAGPDLGRLPAAVAMGNPFGMTDRLDHVWLRNGVQPGDAMLVGSAWPDTPTWPCSRPEQLANAAEAADALGVEPSGCLPSDHAGIVATVTLPRSAAQDAALVDAGSPSLSPLAVPGILAIVVVVGLAVPTLAIAGIVALGSRGRGRRRGDGSGAA